MMYQTVLVRRDAPPNPTERELTDKGNAQLKCNQLQYS